MTKLDTSRLLRPLLYGLVPLLLACFLATQTCNHASYREYLAIGSFCSLTPLSNRAGGIFVSCILYLCLVLTIHRLEQSRELSRPEKSLVILGVIVLSLSAILFAPYYSSDSYGYAALGRQLGFYGESPYLKTLRSLDFDPVIHSNPFYWKFTTSSYGPLSLLVFSIPSLLGFTSNWELLFFLKIIFAISFLLAAFLAARLIPQRNSGMFYTILASLALNPMLLYLLIVEAHSEALMLPLVILLLSAPVDRVTLRHPILISFMLLLKATSILLCLPCFFIGIKDVDTFRTRFLKTCQNAAKIGAFTLPLIYITHYLFEGAKFPFASNYIHEILSHQDRRTPSDIGLLPHFIFQLLKLLQLSQVNDQLDVACIIARWAGLIAGGSLVLWVQLRKNITTGAFASIAFLNYSIFLVTTNYIQPWYYVPLFCVGLGVFCDRTALLSHLFVLTFVMFSGTFGYFTNGFDLLSIIAPVWGGYLAIRTTLKSFSNL